jgi:hypothetical protein
MSRLCFLLILISSLSVTAQGTYLYLNKLGRTTKVKFYEKETIRFKLKGDDYFTAGRITGFEDEAVKVENVAIPLDQIESIDIRDKNFSMFSFRSTPRKLAFAGYSYVFIDWFNRSVVAGQQNVGIDTRVAMVSTGLIGTSYLLKALRKKYFTIGGRKVIAIINTNYKIDS